MRENGLQQMSLQQMSWQLGAGKWEGGRRQNVSTVASQKQAERQPRLSYHLLARLQGSYSCKNFSYYE